MVPGDLTASGGSHVFHHWFIASLSHIKKKPKCVTSSLACCNEETPVLVFFLKQAIILWELASLVAQAFIGNQSHHRSLLVTAAIWQILLAGVHCIKKILSFAALAVSGFLISYLKSHLLNPSYNQAIKHFIFQSYDGDIDCIISQIRNSLDL